MQEPRRIKKKTKATSMDIAHRAGVSQATVSRVLRGSPLVNAETRKRVEEVVRELNYKVDRHASSLRTQRSGTLALLLFEDPTPDDSHINPFFLSMLGSITRACAKHGHDLLVSFQQLSDDWHADYEDSMKADGLILLGYGDYIAYESKLAHLVAQGTHFVRWGAVLQGQPGISIGCDNAAAARWRAPPDAARAPQGRLPRRCVDPLPGILRPLLRLRCGAARRRPAHEPGLAGGCRQFRSNPATTPRAR